VTAFLTPAAVAERLVIDVDAVTALIRGGELNALNVGRGKVKPRYRIDSADLDRFLEARRTGPTLKPTRRRKTGPKTDRVQFYPES
jgi:excisionase family DNA binding protein